MNKYLKNGVIILLATGVLLLIIDIVVNKMIMSWLY